MNYTKKLLIQALRIKNTDDAKYVCQVIKIIHDYFNPAKHYITSTKNFRLSRGASLNFIMKNRLRTCGSLSCVAAVILRKLGFQVRLVNGKRRTAGHWIRHAWIEVKLKDKWQPFDVFAKNFKLDAKKNKKISTYNSWSELRLKDNNSK